LKTGLTILFCFAIATVAFSQSNGGANVTPQAVAQKSLDAYAALTSYSDTGQTVESGAGQTNRTTFSIRMQRTNLFKVQWILTGGNQTNTGTWWADGHPLFSPDDTCLLTSAAGQPANTRPVIVSIPFAIPIVNEASGEATIVPQLFLNMEPSMGNILASLAANEWNSGGSKTELTEGKTGDVDCYLITITQEGSRSNNSKWRNVRRLGIGKRDYLLHQFQFVSDNPDRTVTQIHENILVNQKYSAADFQEKIPDNNSSATLHLTPPAKVPGQPKK
jgi:outer membrane lipoprotein-sorting protein